MNNGNFIFYQSWADAIGDLPDKTRLNVYDAIVKYAKTGIQPEMDELSKLAFKFIRADIDTAKAKYNERCRKNRENIEKRWNKNESNCIQPNTSVYERIQANTNGYETIPNNNDNDNKNDNNKIIVKGKTQRFSPPTIDELKSYCQERKNNVDAERFFNFYEMKGWMVGKNKMKDWKAAVRTWEGKKTSSARPIDTSERDNRNIDGIWNY